MVAKLPKNVNKNTINGCFGLSFSYQHTDHTSLSNASFSSICDSYPYSLLRRLKKF